MTIRGLLPGTFLGKIFEEILAQPDLKHIFTNFIGSLKELGMVVRKGT